MSLGFAEIRRLPGKFAAVAGAVGFIVFLALILTALSDGLYLGSTGAFRSTPADAFVFSESSEFELTDSSVDSSAVEAVADVDGVEDVGRLSRLVVNATVEGNEIQLTLVGADPVTTPSELAEGERPETGTNGVLVDELTLRRGIEIGSVISVTDGPDLEVVGVARDGGFGLTTAWTDFDQFVEIRGTVRPELADSTEAETLGVVTSSADTAQAIEASTGLSVATPEEAIGALPAASQQKTTLDGIVYTTFLVAAIVVGLFFALVTLEKRNEYAVLKAIGLSNWSLIGAILTQALIASVVGFVVGYGLTRLAGLLIPGDVPALFIGSTALFVLAATLIIGPLGAVFSFRRVIKIDPATALGGAQ